jgi:hypothetical protein
MNKMKTIGMIAFAFFLLSVTAAKAQNETSSYNTALGVKVWGNGGGISVKHFIGDNHALEGIGYFWSGGIRVTGLYEFHFDIAGAPGLKWYVGPGAHVGFYNDKYYDPNYSNGNGSGAYIGIDGVLGLDYKFTGAPINLSIDWQPSFEFGSNRGFVNSWGGLGIRYTF